MRRLLSVFIAVEAVALTLYVLVTLAWLDTKQAGPLAFPGSPDWGYMYQQARIYYVWIEGLVVGILLGGLAVAIASRNQAGRLWGVHLAVWIFLALCVVVGWVVEANAVPSVGDTLVPDSPLEHSRHT